MIQEFSPDIIPNTLGYLGHKKAVRSKKWFCTRDLCDLGGIAVVMRASECAETRRLAISIGVTTVYRGECARV